MNNKENYSSSTANDSAKNKVIDASATTGLVDILTLERLDENLFCSNRHIPNHRNALFGGQVLSQSLAATCATVDEWSPHSLHGYFLRAGSSEIPVQYRVERLRDGRSFCTRRVDAVQNHKTIFTMTVSFHMYEEGSFKHHQALEMEVPAPESLEHLGVHVSRAGLELPTMVTSTHALELRPVSTAGYFDTQEVEGPGLFWLRGHGDLPADPRFHRCALALASDRALMAASTLGHPICLYDKTYYAASLDHSVWFHRDFNIKDWLLYVIESPWGGSGRGLNRGFIYSRDGELVATTSQEGLVRRL